MKLGGKFLVAVGVALFLALMVGAIVPLIVTDLYRLTDPVVCPEDDLQAAPRKEHFSDRHGTGFTLHIDCVDENGKAVEEVTGLAFITIVGAAFVPIFVLMFFWMLIPRKSSPVAPSVVVQMSPQERPSSGKPPGLTGKLEELAEARDAGLITDEEYDQKKQELLDKL